MGIYVGVTTEAQKVWSFSCVSEAELVEQTYNS